MEQKTITKGTVILAASILGIALVIGLMNIAERKSDYITVGGQADVVMRPDIAAITFSVVSLKDTAQDAQDENAKTIA